MTLFLECWTWITRFCVQISLGQSFLKILAISFMEFNRYIEKNNFKNKNVTEYKK